MSLIHNKTITLNWSLFNLSNNTFLDKIKLDCIILRDDKKFAPIHMYYYTDIHYTTFYTYNFKDIINDIDYMNEYETKIKSQLELIANVNNTELLIYPIYNNFDNYENSDNYETNETPKGIKKCNVINVGIFILNNFSFKCYTYYAYRIYNFMLSINNGLVCDSNISKLETIKEEYYPDLFSSLKDNVFINQNGYNFNIIKSICSTKKNIENKTIKLRISGNINGNLNNIDYTTEEIIYKKINIYEILQKLENKWPIYQIIWNTSQIWLKSHNPYNSFQSGLNNMLITNNTTDKYKNIAYNQYLLQYNLPLIEYNNLSINKHNDIDDLVSSVSQLNVSKSKKISKCSSPIKDTRKERLKKYAKYSGSKHIHYYRKEKADKSLVDMLSGLNM